MAAGGDTNLNDPDALMILRLKGVIAAGEVAKTRRRIQRKKLELAERGAYPGGGTRPFGYERDGVTINEVEAALIREAAQRTIEGASTYSIRKDWDARGVSTVKGNPWTNTSLKTTLTNPRIAGLRQHQGEVIGDAAWPAILDRAAWEQLRTILTDPSRRQPSPSRDYPLRGVLRCAECGGFLASIPRAGNRHYGCKKDAGGCGRIWISADNVESYVFGIAVPLADSRSYATPCGRKTPTLGTRPTP